MLLSLNNCYATMEMNKLYALPTLLDSRFKIRVFSLSSAVIQVRQCLTEEFISCQSAIAEASDNPPAAKRQHRESSQEEQSSLWYSFNSNDRDR